MAIVIVIDVIVVASLMFIALTRGLERALPLFVFLTVLLPFEAQLPIPGLFMLTGQRAAIVTLVILYLVLNGGASQPGAMKTTPLKILLMIHVAWCVISTADSIVPVDSVKKMLFEVIEYYLLYFIIVSTVTQVKTIHRMMGAMVFAVLIACVFGAFEEYSAWRITNWFPYVPGRFSGDDGRNYSTFSNCSLFGGAISFAIVEALYILTLAKTTARKVYLWFALLIMFLNIYKIVTRGPWLALIIGLFLLLVLGDTVTRKRIAVLVALSVAVMVIRPGVYETIKSLYSATLDTSDPDNIKGDSFEYRFVLRDVAQQALHKSFKRELWGYGLESFYSLHLTAPFYDNPAYPFESCDSSWIELMVETGYVGWLLIAILLIKPAMVLLRDFRKISKPQRYLCAILFINMVQYYFMMTNVALYGWGQTAYMLWMWIAMAMVYKNALANEKSAEEETEAAPAKAQFELVGAPGL